MKLKRHTVPQCADIFVDFEAMRTQAAAYGIRRAQMPSDAMLRFRPTLAAVIVAGFVVCALVPVAFSSFSDKQADAHGSNKTYAVSEKIKNNTEALRRSRAWWEGYGRRHMQARHSAVNETD